jgi:hypothetical protein
LRFLRFSRKPTFLLFQINKFIALSVMTFQNRASLVVSTGRCIMRSKPRTEPSSASPDDYRQFAADNMRRCLAMPSHLRRTRMVQLMLAKAWHQLADQAEELRKQHRTSAAV